MPLLNNVSTHHVPHDYRNPHGLWPTCESTEIKLRPETFRNLCGCNPGLDAVEVSVMGQQLNAQCISGTTKFHLKMTLCYWSCKPQSCSMISSLACCNLNQSRQVFDNDSSNSWTPDEGSLLGHCNTKAHENVGPNTLDKVSEKFEISVSALFSRNIFSPPQGCPL